MPAFRTHGDTAASRAGRRRLLQQSVAAAFLVGGPLLAAAAVFLTQEQALEKAFPGAEFRRGTVYLTEAQQRRIEDLSGADLPSAIVYPYTAWKDGTRVGTAYFDTHRVRTLPETVLFALDAEGRIQDVEVLSFKEPEEYLAPDRWYAQFLGQRLDPALALNRKIDGIVGATLTARATTRAARRTLATHRVLQSAPSE